MCVLQIIVLQPFQFDVNLMSHLQICSHFHVIQFKFIGDTRHQEGKKLSNNGDGCTSVEVLLASTPFNACLASFLFPQLYPGPVPPSAVQSLSHALGSALAMILPWAPRCSLSVTLVMFCTAPQPYVVRVSRTTWHNGTTPCRRVQVNTRANTTAQP